MADYHWSFRTELRAGSLLDTLSYLDTSGYHSALVQFQVHSGDPFIQAAYMASNTTNLRYIVALRPYALTPAYAKMMCNSFTRVYGDAISLNIVSGTFDEENELFIKNTTLDDRRQLVRDFIREFYTFTFDNNACPPIAVTGSSDFSIETAKELGNMLILLKSDFLLNKDKLRRPEFSSIKKCVKVSVIIEDTEELAKIAFLNEPQTNREAENIIYGTIESVAAQISYLEKLGATDILLSNTLHRLNDRRVHLMVKLLTGTRA